MFNISNTGRCWEAAQRLVAHTEAWVWCSPPQQWLMAVADSGSGDLTLSSGLDRHYPHMQYTYMHGDKALSHRNKNIQF